ncbi:PadR family transcriptional regulator [Saccharibacillus sp. CPCC 101409]|uniref:PadR family transcriptional regulator n=1 Tax=Saccharibacillus sp. CPCC 101409 TaxID=3058041 RepID=UPI0026718E58|nr:PadR family transcriptional regulator [Saccharibacillus sp. CPCC 101409]MDO3411268.1 PadR family transcriptional regulator [Saccharibacillus sp. CPCC 101409]
MKVSKELLKGSTGTLVLTVLSNKSMYGYELIKELETRSDGVFALKEGTLYPILHAMEAERWVDSYWEESGGRKRKYYTVTESGKKRLSEKTEEWRIFSGAVNAVLGEGRV